LVAAHGGECRVEDAAGGGSRFVVELPDGGLPACPPVRPPAVPEAQWPAS
jgi:hypothetical protein